MLETNVMVHVRFPIRSIEASTAFERFVHRSTAERRLARRGYFTGQINMDLGGVVIVVAAEIVIRTGVIVILVTETTVARGSSTNRIDSLSLREIDVNGEMDIGVALRSMIE